MFKKPFKSDIKYHTKYYSIKFMKSCISFSFPSNYNKKIFLHNIKHNIHKYPFYYVHKISPHWDNPEIIWSLYFSWNIFELSCSVSQKQSQPRSGERLCDKSIFVPWNVPRQEWKLHAYYSLDFCISDSNYFSFSLFEKILFINIYKYMRSLLHNMTFSTSFDRAWSLRIYTGFHISWRVVWVTSNFRRFKRGFSRWKLARVSDGIKFYTYTRIQIKFHL